MIDLRMFIALMAFAVAVSVWTLATAYYRPDTHGLLAYVILAPMLGLFSLNHLADRYFGVPRWSIVVIWFGWTAGLLLGTIYASRRGDH